MKLDRRLRRIVIASLAASFIGDERDLTILSGLEPRSNWTVSIGDKGPDFRVR